MTIYLQVGREPLKGNFDLSVRSWDSKLIELGFLKAVRLVQPAGQFIDVKVEWNDERETTRFSRISLLRPEESV
jgi:hypothetical protein